MVSKLRLKRVPLCIFTVVRTGLGAVIFFFAAIYLYGTDHFMDAFSPLLWQTMAFYGAVIVVGGQLLWITGIKGSSASNVSLATSFAPVAGVGFAFLIL
ncbi:MAG: EamA family transporter, partial [Planctomycetota bacterium]